MSPVFRRYRITGLVQGIGFRPYVAETAEALGIGGSVANHGGSVLLGAAGEEAAVDELIRRLFELPGVRIQAVELLEETSVRGDDHADFIIEPSLDQREAIHFLPPDLGTCPSCERELFDPGNRRAGHPFLSCASCGPRFTILDRLPYDRPNTAMAGFSLCPSCQEEYTSPGERRRHAQTICCHQCGPRLQARFTSNERFGSGKGESSRREGLTGEGAMEAAVEVLAAGGIIALKDIGGYHFAFRADATEAAMRLRAYKHRAQKPFAVMFYNVEAVRREAVVSDAEEQWLGSPARPILLLERRQSDGIAPEVLGDSSRIGAMLPCNPLQLMLGKRLGPLVMTSGNFCGEPMIIDDEVMMERAEASGVIDLVLYHDRPIRRGLDDSILQVVSIDGRDVTQILRRARGFVPVPILLKQPLPMAAFAAGGDLKAAFGLGEGRGVYLSGHFGDLGNETAGQRRKEAISDFERLLTMRPKRAVADLHPGYHSVRECKSGASGIVERIQHHHAHILSVMAEHGLGEEVLGVAFDGTGYGTDGKIWGGEFLLCTPRSFVRTGHLRSVAMPGGNVSAENCDAAAFSYLLMGEEGLAQSFVEARGKVRGAQEAFALWRAALARGVNRVFSGSVGRLFDGAAAILDIVHENSYEGQAPMRLQAAAEACQWEEVTVSVPAFPIRQEQGGLVADPVPVLSELFRRKLAGEDRGMLALAFHISLAEMTAAMCEEIRRKHDFGNRLALSGGTFVNGLLLKLLLPRLKSRGFTVFLNEQVPPGDGGLALGQLYHLTEE